MLDELKGYLMNKTKVYRTSFTFKNTPFHVEVVGELILECNLHIQYCSQFAKNIICFYVMF